MIERWEKIDDCNLYVSNMGRIKNKRGKIRKLHIANNGYYMVPSWNYTKKKRELLFVHRMVAKYFLPTEKMHECVNHIDGNKLNNYVENLEWCSLAYNTKHAYKNGLIQNFSSIQVIETGTIFKSIADCIRWLRNNGYPKAGHSNIIMCIQGKRHTAYGHTYKYCEVNK